jgi:hypothetical protein
MSQGRDAAKRNEVVMMTGSLQSDQQQRRSRSVARFRREHPSISVSIRELTISSDGVYMRSRWFLCGIALLLLTAAPAARADSLSPEYPLGTIELEPAGLLQSHAVAASNGLDFLVAWQDEREAAAGGRIRYTMMVSREGDLLFPEGRPVPGSQDGFPIAAFWTGTDYVIFATGAGGNGAVRIGSDGLIVQNEILIPIGSQVQAYASNGSTYLAVFTEPEGDQANVVIQLLDGSFGAAAQATIPTAPNGGTVVAHAASHGEERWCCRADYLVVWAANRTGMAEWDVRAVRISDSGAILGAPVLIGTFSAPVLPRVASNGNGYLVTISEETAAPRLYLAAFDANGQLLGGGAGLLADGFSTGIIAVQGEYLVPVYGSTFAASSDIALYRLGPNGSIAGISTLSSAEGNQSAVVSADGGDRVLFVWQDGRRQRGEPIDLFFAFTSPGGSPLEGNNDSRGLPVTLSPPSQTAPAVAWDGTNYLAVWVEAFEEGRHELYAGRFTRAGTALDGRGFRIGTEESRPQFRPEVTFDGANFVVVWREGAGFEFRLLATRISTEGRVLSPSPIEIAPVLVSTSYAIASNGNGSAVLFTTLGPAAQEEIRFARISRDGAVLDAGGRILNIAQRRPIVDLASDGRDYLAVWSGPDDGAVFSMLISAAGAGGTALQIAASGREPVVAAGAGRYLAAYSSGAQIRGQLLAANGLPLAAERILAEGAATSPQERTRDLGFDGLRFVLVWAFAQATVPFDPAPPRFDIRARVISRDGLPLGPDGGIFISATPGHDSWPAVAAGGASSAIVYSRISLEASGIRRAFTRILSADPPRQRPARR